MCTASVSSVVLIAVDQYFAVLEPLRYHSIIRKRATWRLFVISWTVSLLVGLIGVANSFYRSTYAAVYPILFSLVVFLIPFIIICYIYFCIYSAAHENSLRTRNNCSSSLFNECSNSELRISHDSVLSKTDRSEYKYKTKGSLRCKSIYKQSKQRTSHESLSKTMKHESKPLLKDRKGKHNSHKAVKVSKPNELYPITSMEDIDLLMTDKKNSPVSPEKTLASLSEGQIVMNIDNKMGDTVSDNEQLDSTKTDLVPVTETVAEVTKQPMFFINNNNNQILNMNNNVKMSSLNRQLISNTIVTSLSRCVASDMFQENKDSTSHSLATSMSDENTSSVISLSQVDSIVSLSSYNPSNSSSMSDITVCQDPVVSYIIHDELLSSYFCDKDFLSSLNVNKPNIAEEPVTSLKGKDHYVRISLGSYNGIENVQVVSAKLDDVIDENINCDKLSCKNSSKPLVIGISTNKLDCNTSSQITSSDDESNPPSHTEQSVETKNKLSSHASDLTLHKQETSQSNNGSCLEISGRKSLPNLTKNESEPNLQSRICTFETQNVSQDKSDDVKQEVRQNKARMFKKNNCTDDRRKQFYENERRKSNDSKCSSDDMESISKSCHYYKNMELFQCPREKTRSIDSVVSRSGLRSFHPSSTRSSLRSTSSTLVNSLKHRISNASMFKYREETRTAKISLSVIILALLSWLPFTVLLLLHSPLFNVINYSQYSSFTFEKFAILCLSSHFVGSPLLFALRNKKIKREMIKMWRNWLCFFRHQDEEKTRLRNSFYNDYHINKQRLQALKEKQRLENQRKTMTNAETMTTADDVLSVERQGSEQPVKSSTVVIQMEDECKTGEPTTGPNTEMRSFLSRLLAMKQKCYVRTKPWGNKCLRTSALVGVDTQRSSISSNTVSTSTTDVCCEV
uniref:Beta-2 adrenergic receptor n=2 Tax=Cacopsylla melanoneura TaxID=428564 RepID=A0A8D8SGI7_9HEMI